MLSDIPVQYLDGHLLIAMPGMRDERFQRSVIYLCAHSPKGAMGLILNRPSGNSINLKELLEQVKGEDHPADIELQVHYGGPVETSRGYVLHSSDILCKDSRQISGELALTTSIDILRTIAQGRGPHHRLLAMGYSGWGPGQLDREIHDNGWLHAPASQDLVFDTDLGTKWERAIATMGVSLARLSGEAGHA